MPLRIFHLSPKHLLLVSLLSISSFLFGACSPKVQTQQPLQAPAERVIIFIPGYKGSALTETKSGDTLWISTAEALFGSKTLAFDLPKLDVQGAGEIQTSGVLGSIPLISLLYSIDAYGKCLARIRSVDNVETPVIPFAYDWRMDNITSIRKLDSLVRELREQGVRQVDVVAHSMGGLILSYYLRYGTQEPETAVENWEGAQLLGDIALTGVPFRGTMLMFRDMKKGTVQGLNKKLLDRTAIASFESSYQLLPDTPSIITPELEPLGDVIFNPDYWQTHRWGLMDWEDEPHSSALQSARNTFTRERLQRAKAFKEKILQAPMKVPTFKRRMINLIGESHPTLAKGMYHPQEQTVVFETDSLEAQYPGLTNDVLWADGDGVVEVSAAKLPLAYLNAFETKEARLPESHQYICGGKYSGVALESFFKKNRRSEKEVGS